MQVKAAPSRPAPPKVEEVKGPPDLYGAALRSATTTTAGLTGILALGFVAPSAAFSSMFTKFGLSSICGYQVQPSSSSPTTRPQNTLQMCFACCICALIILPTKSMVKCPSSHFCGFPSKDHKLPKASMLLS